MHSTKVSLQNNAEHST